MKPVKPTCLVWLFARGEKGMKTYVHTAPQVVCGFILLNTTADLGEFGFAPRALFFVWLLL